MNTPETSEAPSEGLSSLRALRARQAERASAERSSIRDTCHAQISAGDWHGALNTVVHGGEELGGQMQQILWAELGGRRNPLAARPPPMPEEVVRLACQHLDSAIAAQGGATATSAKRNRDIFLGEFARSAGADGPYSSDLLQDLAWRSRHMSVASIYWNHATYGNDPKETRLRHASSFWRSYEQDVKPEHFATIKAWMKNRRVTVRDHRGQSATADPSNPYSAKTMNGFAEYAQEAQKAYLEAYYDQNHHSGVTGEPQGGAIKDIKGEPHVLVYRGVAGNYGAKIRNAFAPVEDENGLTVDSKTVVVPCAHLASWSTDDKVARRFAQRSINGHEQRAGIVVRQWKPLKDLLHSGYHNVLPCTRGHHPDENELIFKHETGKLRIRPENIHTMQEPKGSWSTPTARPNTRVAAAKTPEQPENLAKMAIKDLVPGRKIGGDNGGMATYAYDHMLPPNAVSNGYSMTVLASQAHGLHANIFYLAPGASYHEQTQVGFVRGVLRQEGPLRCLRIDHARMSNEHQGGRLGQAAYEALMTHAFHHEGAQMVTGDVHSGPAAIAHRRLSDKHGMDYEAEENHQQPPSEYDDKHGPYRYAIKDELPMSKPTTDVSMAKNLDEDGVVFRTGTPVSFKFTHRKQSTPNFGGRFGQDVEPAGRYVTHGHHGSPGKIVEAGNHPVVTFHGHLHFDNPLVLEHGGYGPTGWKQQLSNMHGGKTGAALSTAVVAAGHDGIVTTDGANTSEIVDLTHLTKSELQKMALADIPVGTPSPDEVGGFDYGHVMHSSLQSSYGLRVFDSPPPQTATALPRRITAIISNPGTRDRWGQNNLYGEAADRGWLDRDRAATGRYLESGVGVVTGTHDGQTLRIGRSEVHPGHRNQGLGLAAYEALLAHAKNYLGCKLVEGLAHSSTAGSVHRRLAEKHGLEYRPQQGAVDPEAAPGEYDDANGLYSYALKSEIRDLTHMTMKKARWQAVQKIANKKSLHLTEMSKSEEPYEGEEESWPIVNVDVSPEQALEHELLRKIR